MCHRLACDLSSADACRGRSRIAPETVQNEQRHGPCEHLLQVDIEIVLGVRIGCLWRPSSFVAASFALKFFKRVRAREETEWPQVAALAPRGVI
jgi:hypothetical protein